MKIGVNKIQLASFPSDSDLQVLQHGVLSAFLPRGRKMGKMGVVAMMPGYWEYLKISCSGRFSYDSCCVTTRNHELDSKERFDLGKSLYVQVMQVTWLLVPCPSQQCCKVL